MDIIETIVLATVQGLLEFIPISSSGHVFIISELIPGWSDPGFIFDAIVHLGALIAILFYYRRAIFGARLSNDWNVKFDEDDQINASKLIIFLIVATVPIGVLGVVLVVTLDEFTDYFRTAQGVGLSLILTSLALFGATLATKTNIKLNDISLRSAFIVGLAQTLAFIPGISRSGVTIAAGVYLKFRYITATRFALALAIPALVGTAALVATRGVGAGEQIDFGALALAFGVAAATSLLSIHILTYVLQRASLFPFSVYTLAAGATVLLIDYFDPTVLGSG